MRQVLREKGFRVAETLQDNEKSAVVRLEKDGQKYIGKWLNISEAGWPGKFQNEQRAYRLFQAFLPDFNTPKRHPESTDGLLIVSYIDAHPHTRERYILEPLPAEVKQVYMSICKELVNWQYAGKDKLRVYDYNARIQKLLNRDQITPEIAEKLTNNYLNQTHAITPQHGDLIPENILLAADNTPTLIDWEYAQLYLPGFDLALLQTTVLGDPQFREKIDELVKARGIEQPFNLNKAIVLLREIRIHEVIPDKNNIHKIILPALRREWADLLKKL